MTERTVNEIAVDIRKNWPNIYFGAKPYVDAMSAMSSFAAPYYADDGTTVGLYFLANAGTWRGPEARRIKAEIKAMLKDLGCNS